ncbi:hypothetical protein BY996DRAFT_6414123 [Phakopsora pachyrhizi]|nr:hypothetical protein BY996DRAFT_6414123 [Phakopsora pachyrhizi]
MFPFSSSSANDSSSSTSTNSNITSSLSSSSSSKAEQLKQEVTQQLALANAQELINKLISNCMDRYLEAYNIVSRTYVDRITKERTQAALASSSKNLESIDGVGLSNEGFR